MIQRKQTLYLLIVLVLLVSMFFGNMVTYTLEKGGNLTETTIIQDDGSITKTTIVGSDVVTFNVWGLYANGAKLEGLIYFTVLFFATIALTLVTIFLYRRREVQLKLCFILGLMLLVMLGFVMVYIYELGQELTDYTVNYSVLAMFPLFALGFAYMAYFRIAKDIALLRSVDRIR